MILAMKKAALLLLAFSLLSPSLGRAQTNIFCPLNGVCNWTGTESYSGLFQLSQPSNQVVFNGFGGNTLTLNAQTPSGNWALSLSDPAGNDSMMYLLKAQSPSNKTIDTAAGNTFKLNGVALLGTTGTGNTVVLQTSPVLSTPSLGVATATSINGLTITPTTGALTMANGKTLTANNSLTLAGTDGKTLTWNGNFILNNNITLGGTDGTAFTFPGSNDTILGAASVATLTGKTFDTAGSGNVFKINGTQISSVVGTGAAVLASYVTTSMLNVQPGTVFVNGNTNSYQFLSNYTPSSSFFNGVGGAFRMHGSGTIHASSAGFSWTFGLAVNTSSVSPLASFSPGNTNTWQWVSTWECGVKDLSNLTCSGELVATDGTSTEVGAVSGNVPFTAGQNLGFAVAFSVGNTLNNAAENLFTLEKLN